MISCGLIASLLTASMTAYNCMAGEPGDRRSASRKRDGREESPDSIAVELDKSRQAKGNAPGNARGLRF